MMDHLTADAQQQLAAFGAHLLREFHRVGQLDDLWIQHRALDTGVLEWVTATKPCGPKCVCARVARFPQECLTSPEPVAALVNELTR